MVKEVLNSSSRENAIKKRRKITSGSDDAEGDIYKRSTLFEEKEAFKRTPNADADLYFETCNSLKKMLAEISELKGKKTADTNDKIMEKVVQAASNVVVLKKLNRLEKVRSTSSRETLNVEKQKTDSTNLQYQNLMYEAAHLMSEYKKCKQFKSKDEDIELVSVEEFLKEAPNESTQPFQNIATLDDLQKHELHLARLEWELTQRKKLAELCSTLESEKKEVADEIVKTKERLAGLAPKLAAVLESTKPLQDYLGLPIEKTYAEHKLAALLPNPLYLFYANTDAYKKVYDVDINLEICGDQDEAIQWKQSQSSLSLEIDESDTEAESREVEENIEIKKRRHRKSCNIDKQEEKKKRILETHPLSIQCAITLKDGPTLTLHIRYCTILNIIVVTSQVICPENISGNSAQEVLRGESLLGELFPEDFGIESPNPGSGYQLKKIGINSFQSLIPNLGYCYVWAQKMCGLDFLSSQNDKSKSDLSCTNIEIVMKMIHKRLKSRLFLASQLQQLEQNVIPAIPDDVDIPCNVVSSLTKWSSVSWQDYCKSPSTLDLIENELVGPNDLIYSATIFRPKSAYLRALVAIKNNYPIQAPIFSLTVNYDGEHHSANSDEIRDMERSVNIGWNTSSNVGWLLSGQLHHLCAYFDVYLETSAPATFPQKSVFFKSIWYVMFLILSSILTVVFSARNRRRPFKFRKVGAGIFTQF